MRFDDDNEWGKDKDLKGSGPDIFRDNIPAENLYNKNDCCMEGLMTKYFRIRDNG
jgi:hypothetical protein